MSVDVSKLVWDSGLSIEELGRRAGHDGSYVGRLLHGLLPVTAPMARKLEAASGIPRLAAYMLEIDPLPSHVEPPSADAA